MKNLYKVLLVKFKWEVFDYPAYNLTICFPNWKSVWEENDEYLQKTMTVYLKELEVE